MATFDAEIAHLKTTLDTASNFATIANEFLDLCENNLFLKSGKRIKVPAFLKLALQIGMQTLQRRYWETPTVIYVPRYDFFHGCILSNGQMGFFFYFRRKDKGLICVNDGDQQLFVRITATVTKDPKDVTMN